MNWQITRPAAARGAKGAAEALLPAAAESDLRLAAREAVARARAGGSFLIVRDTARRIAGANRDESREEAADAVARLLIEECARQGVAMLSDTREAVERLRRDGLGSVVAL